MHRNLATPKVDHKNKWESTGFMDGYYVVGIIATPYPGCGVPINIVSKDDHTYRITLGNMPHCTYLDFMKMYSQSIGKKEKWMCCKYLYYILDFVQGGL